MKVGCYGNESDADLGGHGEGGGGMQRKKSSLYKVLWKLPPIN